MGSSNSSSQGSLNSSSKGSSNSSLQGSSNSSSKGSSNSSSQGSSNSSSKGSSNSSSQGSSNSNSQNTSNSNSQSTSNSNLQGSASSSNSSSEFSKRFFSSSSSNGNKLYSEEGFYIGKCNCEDLLDPNFCTVKKKLLEAGTFSILNLETEDQKDQLTYSLCDSVAFKNRYLKLNCLDHNKHIESRLHEEMDNLMNLTNFANITQKAIHRIFNRIVNHRRSAKTLNVKLFINKTGVSESSFVRMAANAAGFEFGAFHVGLDIDGVILEWGRGIGGQSLVVPSVDAERFLVYARINFDQIFPDGWLDQLKFAVNHPIDFHLHLFRVITDMTVRLVTFGRINNDQMGRLSKRCVYYNTTFDYDFMSRNCQVFMNDVLDSIHMQFKPEGEFKKFLDRITREGNGDFIFKANKLTSLDQLETYADLNWNSLGDWDKRLLVCYSDLMDQNYKQTSDPKWGPINAENWNERITNLASELVMEKLYLKY